MTIWFDMEFIPGNGLLCSSTAAVFDRTIQRDPDARPVARRTLTNLVLVNEALPCNNKRFGGTWEKP